MPFYFTKEEEVRLKGACNELDFICEYLKKLETDIHLSISLSKAEGINKRQIVEEVKKAIDGLEKCIHVLDNQRDSLARVHSTIIFRL